MGTAEDCLEVYTEHSYSVISGTTQPNSQVFPRWKEFDNIIEQFLLEQNIPGASIAVSYDGEILYQQGYGTAGGGRRVQPSSLFRIVSISKPITSTIVMKLIEQQKLSLASTVFGRNGILKKYKTRDKRMKNITVQHLLQHSGGWDRDKVGDAVFVRPQCVIQEHPDTPAYNSALLSYALRRKLQFTPGTPFSSYYCNNHQNHQQGKKPGFDYKFDPNSRPRNIFVFTSTWHSYSNLGYLALGEIIETVTNQPFHNSMLNFLHTVHIDNILLGLRKRACWLSKEVEYFNNKEPQVVDSLYPNEGEVLPQYGGMAMESSASYGGLVSDTTSLLQLVHCWERALNKDRGVSDRTGSTLDTLNIACPNCSKDVCDRTGSTLDTLNIACPNNCGKDVCDRTGSTLDTLNIACPNNCGKDAMEDHLSALWEDCIPLDNISPPYCSCSNMSSSHFDMDHLMDSLSTEPELQPNKNITQTNINLLPKLTSLMNEKSEMEVSYFVELPNEKLEPNSEINVCLGDQFSQCRHCLHQLHNLKTTRALCEKCLKKLHSLSEVKTLAGAGCSCNHPALLKYHLAVECMAKPAYENGHDWYGLGWDVQDGGHSWGHTGGMEGTSGTLFHHRSGYNWCLLLNSWAADSDLNGVVKCALSSVPGVSIYNCHVVRVTDNGGTRIMTRDLSQVILLGVSETSLLKEILQLQNQNYVLKQITVISENLTTTTKIHKSRFYPKLPYLANKETKYCAIFCKSTTPFNYFVLFNKSTTELEKAIEKYKTENAFVYYLDSYPDYNSELKFTAVFKIIKNGFNDENLTVYLAINAIDYIKKAKELISSYDILVQSVTSIGVNLYVSVVLSAKPHLSKGSNVQVCTDTESLSFSHKTNGRYKSKKSKSKKEITQKLSTGSKLAQKAFSQS